MDKKQLTSPLQNAIIISSIIGSFLSNYDNSIVTERRKAIVILKARIKKFMFKRSKSNTKDFLLAVTIADNIWQKAIHHFINQNIRIDIVAITIKLHNLYEEELAKYTNIHPKQINAFAINYDELEDVTIELNSYKLGDYILDELSHITGVRQINLNYQQSKN